MPNLARQAILPSIELSVANESPTDPRADGDIDHRAASPACPEAMLTQSAGIGVVIQAAGDAKFFLNPLAQRESLPAGHVD